MLNLYKFLETMKHFRIVNGRRYKLVYSCKIN